MDNKDNKDATDERQKLFDTALNYQWKHNHREAIEYYRKLLNLGPPQEQRAEVYNNMGVSYIILGEYDKAIEQFTKAGNIGCLGLGTAHYLQCKYPEAKECYQEAINLWPNAIAGYQGMSNVLFAEQDYTNALKCLNFALQIRPDSQALNYIKGGVCFALGKHEESIECYEKAVSVSPAKAAFANKLINLQKDIIRINELTVKCTNYINLSESVVNEIIRLRREYELEIEIIIEHGITSKVLLDIPLLPEEVKDGDGKERNNLESRIEKLEKQLIETENYYIQIREETEGIKEKQAVHGSILADHAEKLADHDKAIADIKQDVSVINDLFREQNEVVKMLAEQVKDIADEQIRSNEKIQKIEFLLSREVHKIFQELLAQQERLQAHAETLEVSGVKDIAEIKEAFGRLSESENAAESCYARVFYWSLLEYFTAYEILHSGVVKGQYISTQETLAIQGVKQAVKYSATLAEGIPLLGGIVGVIDEIIGSVYTGIKKIMFDAKVNAVHNIVTRKILPPNDISSVIAKTALDLVNRKKNEILPGEEEIKNDSIDKIKKIGRAISTKLKTCVDKFKAKILNKELLEGREAEGATKAIEDIAKLLAYLYKNSNEIIKDIRSLEEIFTSIILGPQEADDYAVVAGYNPENTE